MACTSGTRQGRRAGFSLACTSGARRAGAAGRLSIVDCRLAQARTCACQGLRTYNMRSPGSEPSAERSLCIARRSSRLAHPRARVAFFARSTPKHPACLLEAPYIAADDRKRSWCAIPAAWRAPPARARAAGRVLAGVHLRCAPERRAGFLLACTSGARHGGGPGSRWRAPPARAGPGRRADCRSSIVDCRLAQARTSACQGLRTYNTRSPGIK